MTIAFTNFASTRTTSILLAGGTSFSVTPGSGANFPATAGGAWFYLVLTDSLTAPTVREVIKVSNRSTDSMATIVRAQDGTSALQWPSGSYCELRLTKGALEDIIAAALQAANNLSDLTNQSAARTNLQLGSMATQNSNSVFLSGGLVSSCQIVGGTLNATPIGSLVPDTGAFTTLAASDAVSGAGFTARFSAPGPVGNVTPSTGAFTTLAASGAVSGAGFVSRFSAPGAIGDVTPGTASFTTLAASGAVSGAGFTAYMASPPAIGGAVPAAGTFTLLEATSGLKASGNPDGGMCFVYGGGYILSTIAAVDGQLLMGKTGFAPVLGTLTGTTSQIVVTNGAGSITLSAPGMVTAFSVNTTAVGNVGAGTDDLMTYSLPANSLSANGKGVRVTISGRIANNANVKTLTFMFGAASVNIAVRQSVDQAWFAVFHIIRTGANTQIITGDTHTSVANFTTTNEGAVVDTTATETDSGAITIKCTGVGVADNDVVQKFMMVEFIN